MAYTTSDGYKEVIYSGDNDNNLTFKYGEDYIEDSSPYISSLKLNNILLKTTNTSFSLDNFVANEMTLVMHNYPIEDLTKEFYFELGSMVNDNYEYVPIGYYKIKDNPTTANGKTTYKLFDRAINFDFNYDAEPLITSNGGSVTILQLLQDMCSKANVELATTDFLHKDKLIGIYDNSISARSYVSYIAELACSIAKIGRDGKLYLIPIKKMNNNSIKIDEEYINQKMTTGDTFKISKVMFESGIVKFEQGDDSADTLFINASNPFISTQEEINDIYNQIVGFEIMSLNTSKILGNISIDSYDFIEFDLTDENNEVVKNVVSLGQYEFEFNGVMFQTFRTTINRTSKATNSSANTPTAKYNRLRQEVNAMEGSLKIVSEKTEQIEQDITTTKQSNGYPITIEDAGAYPLESIEIEGKSEQDGTPTPTAPVEIESVEGVTNLLNTPYTEDNKLTDTATRDDYYVKTDYYAELEAGETYTFSCKTSGTYGYSGETDCYLMLNKEFSTIIHMDNKDKFTFTPTVSGKYYLRYDVNVSGETHSFWNFQIEEGSIVHTYVPYGRWLEQKTIYEAYKENTALIDLNKKDLFDNELELGTFDNSTGLASANNSCIRSVNFIEVIPNTTYTIKNDKGYAQYIYEYSESQNFIKYTANTNSKFTFTTSETTKYIKFRTTAGNVQNDLTAIFKIYEGVETDDYYRLASIGDVKNTFKNGVLTQRIGKVVLDGNEVWTVGANGTNAYKTLVNNPIKRDATANVISSHFVGVAYDNRGVNQNNIVYIYLYDGTGPQLYFRNTDFATLDEFKTWLSENPVEVYYILETPIEHTLDYEKLELHEGYNNITLNDELEPNMSVVYLTDSKMNAQYATKAELKIESDAINLRVDGKIDDKDLTSAEIIARINEDTGTSEAKIKADNINLNGVVTANENFKINTDGSMKAKAGTFGAWVIDDNGNLYADREINGTMYRTYIQQANAEDGGNTWAFSTQVSTDGGKTFTSTSVIRSDGYIIGNKVYGDYIGSYGDIVTDGHLIVHGDLKFADDRLIPIQYASFVSDNVDVASNNLDWLMSGVLGAGRFIIVTQFGFSANSEGLRRVNISTTKASGDANIQHGASPSGVTRIRHTQFLNLTKDTTLYWNVYHNSGATLTCNATAWIYRIQ